MTPDQPALDQVPGGSAGCLTVPLVNEDGSVGFMRFILADASLHRETAASLGRPLLSDDEYQAMVKDITF